MLQLLLNHIGQIDSKLFGTRILPIEGKEPLPIEVGGREIEHTFVGTGTILGVNLDQTFTSKSIYSGEESRFSFNPNLFSSGFYESQSNGLLIRPSDGARITWTGHAMGMEIAHKNTVHYGIRFFRTSLSSLAKTFNGLVAVVNVSIDSNGVMKEVLWELK
jgi:hypothetical protein